MEHTTQTAPNPSEQEKQAMVARVGKRGMAGQEAACPLTWTDPGLLYTSARMAAVPASMARPDSRNQKATPTCSARGLLTSLSLIHIWPKLW